MNCNTCLNSLFCTVVELKKYFSIFLLFSYVGLKIDDIKIIQKRLKATCNVGYLCDFNRKNDKKRNWANKTICVKEYPVENPRKIQF